MYFKEEKTHHFQLFGKSMKLSVIYPDKLVTYRSLNSYGYTYAHQIANY